LLLFRELDERALDVLLIGSTIPLVYYEIGNALWKECFLLKRIDVEKVARLLSSIFIIIRKMDLIRLEEEEHGTATLNVAGSLNITYYDASYLAAAREFRRTLVTDDEKLIVAAKKLGVRTVESTTFH
jgi:predicted nucleic acid-binding protein